MPALTQLPTTGTPQPIIRNPELTNISTQPPPDLPRTPATPPVEEKKSHTIKKTVTVVILICLLGLLVLASYLIKKSQSTKTILPTPSPAPSFSPSTTSASAGSSTPLAISDKWKTWSDPNGFSVKYPPFAIIKHLNELTTIDYKSDNGRFILSFCKNCQRAACTGDCNQQQEIEVTLGGQTKAKTQIWPSEKKYFTFQVEALYPNTYNREKLSVSAEYENEAALTDINLILSTFDWKDKATPTPTALPSTTPSPTPDYF